MKDNGLEVDYDNPKAPSICRKTLCLKKENGGCNLIEYTLKMKAFRILIVHKYLKNNSKTWTSILKYWYSLHTMALKLATEFGNSTLPCCKMKICALK